MASRRTCEHLNNSSYLEEILQSPKAQIQDARCNDCIYHGHNLWICLEKNCFYIGCPEIPNDHSSMHNLRNPTHLFQLNLSIKTVWCFSCRREIPMEARFTNGIYTFGDTISMLRVFGLRGNTEDTSIDFNINLLMELSDDTLKNRVAVGLQNMGNTCYMNAALQALSNTEPFSRFFLECPFVIDYLTQTRRTSLGRSYKTLVEDIYLGHTGRYLVPTHFLIVIKSIFPMFRGTQQHDAQEFLRNFMVHLHEELKYAVVEDVSSHEKSLNQSIDSNDEGAGDYLDSDVESSEAGYETCDSAVDSECSSLGDSTQIGKSKQKRGSRPLRSHCSSRSISPVLCKRRKKENDEKPQELQIRYHSIISDIFNGKLLSSVKCLTCNRVSNQTETFQDLSLPIPTKASETNKNKMMDLPLPAHEAAWLPWLLSWLTIAPKSWWYPPVVSLYDCLSAFFSVDELKGDNMYKCEKCKNLRNGSKYNKVLQLPEVLCIHLKRFRLELMSSSKITSIVTFPLKGLDMSPFLNETSTSKVSEYDLISIICHQGTVGTGHYTTYAISGDNWFEFDDQYVRKVSVEQVQSCEAYVLFYRKCQTNAKESRENVVTMYENLNHTNDVVKARISRLWFSKFKHCVEPGSINNYDFLCHHGAIHPEKLAVLDNLSVEIPLNIYNYLHKLYGGCGPNSNLIVCNKCKARLLTVTREDKGTLEDGRQKRLKYLVSKHWYIKWQAYVRKETTMEPGPVDNNKIDLDNIDLNETVQVPKNLWDTLMEIYGGGPDISLEIKISSMDTDETGEQDEENDPLNETETKESQPEGPQIDDNINSSQDNDQLLLNKPTSNVGELSQSQKKRSRKKRAHHKRNQHGKISNSKIGTTEKKHD